MYTGMYMYLTYVHVLDLCTCTWLMYLTYVYVLDLCSCTWLIYIYLSYVHVLDLCTCTLGTNTVLALCLWRGWEEMMKKRRMERGIRGRWKHTEQNRELQYMGNNSLLKISSFTYYDVTYLLFVYNELFFINTNTR